MAHHRRGLRRFLKDNELLDGLEAGEEPLELGKRRLAMIRYARKLTRAPASMVPADVESLRATGFSDPDILAICEVVAYYAFANRMADGLGVELEEDSQEPPPTMPGLTSS